MRAENHVSQWVRNTVKNEKEGYMNINKNYAIGKSIGKRTYL
jgi:hypothetical protein